MNDDQRIDQESLLRRKQSMPSKSYNFLLGLSKKLGMVATKSFVEVRDFLKQDITLPSSERFFSNFASGSLLRRNQDAAKAESNREKAEEATKKEGKALQNPNEKLENVLKQSREIIASANTVFPISLFPDTLLVDRTKVTIIRRNFFWSEDVMSIRIQDVLNVSASVGPLFGSLTIASRVMSTVDHFQINYFWRNDASYLKHIIQGYVIAQHNKLDTAHLEKDELIKTLEELGQDSTHSS